MSQRYVRPSMGAMRQPLMRYVAAVPSTCPRSFHVSARQLEDQPSDSKPSAPAPEAQRQPRRQRNAAVVNQIQNLRHGLAGGVFPSGVTTQKSQDGEKLSLRPKVITPRKPIAPGAAAARGPAPPGTLVRAPSTLRIRRNTPAGARPAGPNLGGRVSGDHRPSNRSGERLKRREKVAKDAAASKAAPVVDDVSIDPKMLDDSTVHHLMRLQRQEWDRKPYTPKYAPGSFEANELIHLGRELFRGEAPPVKIWGRMEKTLGIVGMHGAEAHLQVRRVPDGDAAPFGKEEENLYETEKAKGTAQRPEVLDT